MKNIFDVNVYFNNLTIWFYCPCS